MQNNVDRIIHLISLISAVINLDNSQTETCISIACYPTNQYEFLKPHEISEKLGTDTRCLMPCSTLSLGSVLICLGKIN